MIRDYKLCDWRLYVIGDYSAMFRQASFFLLGPVIICAAMTDYIWESFGTLQSNVGILELKQLKKCK